MKRSAVLLSLLSDFLLLCFGVLGTLLCPLTALDLPCDYGFLLSCCLLLCLLFTLLCRFCRRVWPFRLAGLAVICWVIFQNWSTIRQTTLALVSTALNQWRATYDWLGFFSWETSVAASETSATLVFLLLAALLVLLLSWAALRRHSLYTTLPLTLPALLVSLAAENASPAPQALFLLLAFWLGLTLTRDLRKNRDTRSMLAALCLPCVAYLAFFGLYLLCSPSDYVRPDYADNAQLRIMQTLVQTGNFQLPTMQSASQHMENLPLDQLDGGPTSNATVLRVRASFTGQLYLRGYSMLNYSDSTWTLGTGGTDYEAYFSALTAAEPTDTVEIRAALDSSGLLYTVYGLCGDLPEGAQLVGDYAISYSGSDSYTLSCSTDAIDVGTTTYGQSVAASSDYLSVDMTAAQLAALTEISEQILASLPESERTVEDIAGAVADYVRSSAVYDLDTPANPEGTDFVLYFLQESHQGYCVHFASATTLLLRNLGIPARYVTGYSVQISRANSWVSVRASDAHAWTEYFNGETWVPLESTPGYDTITLEADPESTSTSAEPLPEDSETPVDESESPEPTADSPSSQTPEPESSQDNSPDASQPAGSSNTAASSGADATQAPLTRFLWLLPIPLLILFFTLRRSWILQRRNARFQDPDPANAFAAMWAYMLRQERHGIVPSEALITLAEKARFSREGASQEDCDVLRRELETAIHALYQGASWPQKLALQYWYVV